MKRISLILIVVFFISACSLGAVAKANPTPTVPPPPTALPQPTPTQIVEPTLALLPTDTAVALPTAAALATDTPAATAATATPEAEAWRIAPMPGTEFVANEKKSDPSLDVIMAKQAANLAVASPYFWDVYTIAPGTRYKDIKDYFLPAITQSGFDVSLDVQGAGEVYLMKFTKKQSKAQIYVQYNGTTPQNKTPAILIFYSNP
jgi:hypothetical protein